VNAVMAGARPEYFPVILALAASGSTAKSSSTTSMTNMAVVNGPIRHEIGMNCGIGALGPYNHANVTIGRAYALLSQNLQGGSVPGETYMGTLGNGLAYSACFAENEEKSPWEPLHVEKGLPAGESAVSVFFGLRYVHEGYGPRETWQEKMRRCLSSGANFPPLLVMDPIVARLFVERGMTYADVTVFDPETAADRATFEAPTTPAAGIEHVFVNGRPVWTDGKPTGEHPGRALRRQQLQAEGQGWRAP